MQQAAPSSAPHRVRNPCLGFGRDATSVPSGRCLGLGSRALSGYESPGSEWEPLLPLQIRGGKQCDRPELWARPQPPRPPPGRTHLRPASRSLRPIECSSAGWIPPSRHLSTNSNAGGGALSARSTHSQAERVSRRPDGKTHGQWLRRRHEIHRRRQTDRDEFLGRSVTESQEDNLRRETGNQGASAGLGCQSLRDPPSLPSAT